MAIDKPSDTISEKLLKKPGIAANKKKVSVIKVSDDESPDFQQIADEMDQIFKKLSDWIFVQLNRYENSSIIS